LGKVIHGAVCIEDKAAGSDRLWKAGKAGLAPVFSISHAERRNHPPEEPISKPGWRQPRFAGWQFSGDWAQITGQSILNREHAK